MWCSAEIGGGGCRLGKAGSGRLNFPHFSIKQRLGVALNTAKTGAKSPYLSMQEAGRQIIKPPPTIVLQREALGTVQVQKRKTLGPDQATYSADSRGAGGGGGTVLITLDPTVCNDLSFLRHQHTWKIGSLAGSTAVQQYSSTALGFGAVNLRGGGGGGNYTGETRQGVLASRISFQISRNWQIMTGAFQKSP